MRLHGRLLGMLRRVPNLDDQALAQESQGIADVFDLAGVAQVEHAPHSGFGHTQPAGHLAIAELVRQHGFVERQLGRHQGRQVHRRLPLLEGRRTGDRSAGIDIAFQRRRKGVFGLDQGGLAVTVVRGRLGHVGERHQPESALVLDELAGVRELVGHP